MHSFWHVYGYLLRKTLQKDIHNGGGKPAERDNQARILCCRKFTDTGTIYLIEVLTCFGDNCPLNF